MAGLSQNGLAQISHDLLQVSLLRQYDILDKLHEEHWLRGGLPDKLFGIETLTTSKLPGNWQPANHGLVDDQLKGLEMALSADQLMLLHGPPGTGKTTTLVQLILALLAAKPHSKILVACESNQGVDNLLEKVIIALASAADKAVPPELSGVLRVGALKSIQNPKVRPHAVEKILRERRLFVEQRESIEAQRRKIDELKADSAEAEEAVKRGKGNKSIGARRRRGKKLRAKSAELEEAVKQWGWLCEAYWKIWNMERRQMLQHYSVQVIGCTLSGAHSKVLEDIASLRKFDLAIIDEAAQGSEIACWQPLLKAKKVVLAGDDCQLGPTVFSEEAQQGPWRLDRSLFERLREEGIGATHMLTTQFRMNRKIMEWVSALMYNGQLVAHQSVRDHELKDLEEVRKAKPPANVLDRMVPLVFLDTALCQDAKEVVNPKSQSKGNKEEVKIAWAHCGMLLEAGVHASDIVLISPYIFQVTLLDVGRPKNRKFKDVNVRVSTIDSIQGAEREAVIISMVRSNPGRRVGFCGNERRMNVAISRARRHVAVIGNSCTLSSDPLLDGLLNHCRTHGKCFGADLPIPGRQHS